LKYLKLKELVLGTKLDGFDDVDLQRVLGGNGVSMLKRDESSIGKGGVLDEELFNVSNDI
jgi:hypothetical protein